MAEEDEVVQFDQNHRLYRHIRDLLRYMSAITLAINCRTGVHKYEPDNCADHQSIQFAGKAVRTPYVSPLDNYIRGAEETYSEIRIVDYKLPDEWEHVGVFKNFHSRIAALVFANFYEENRPWLESHFKHQNNFPDLWQFARHLRNAVSHGGRLNVEKENAPVGRWQNLSYGYDQTGRDVLTLDMAVADIIILMLDLSDDLYALDAPMPSVT